MKPSIFIIPWLILGALTAQAQQEAAPNENPPQNTPQTIEQPNPAPRPAYNDRPQVRVDLLMVSVPQETALSLLPALRDRDRISSAQETLLKLVAQKEVTLIDWPELTLHSGGRADCETIVEQRYPTEFDQPIEPTFSTGQKQRTPEEQALRFLRLGGFMTPQTFETRNTGVFFEVGATVVDDGNSANLQLYAHLVRLEKMRQFPTTSAEGGKSATVEQPVFQTRKVSSTLSLHNGERRVVYVGKVTEPSERIELFILGIQIVPKSATSK